MHPLDPTQVIDNSSASRFELPLGTDVAFVDYRRRGTVVVLTHAEVPASLQGKGIGAALVQGTLDLIRQRGEKMVPQCSYVAAWVRRHPDYQSLVA